jgi:RES domain-containing protein
MEVYRITHAKWAQSLVASGYPARWNSNGIKIIYTAGSRSLACLENIVHRKKNRFNSIYKTAVVYIPDNIKREIISIEDLPDGWHAHSEDAYILCRRYGDLWYHRNSSAILFVPSAIIKNEINVLINMHNPDFEKVKIVDVESFMFDPRI